MSRRTSRRGPRPGARQVPPARAGAPGVGWLRLAWLLPTLVVLVAAGLWSWRDALHRRSKSAPANPVAQMDPHAAYARAHALLSEGRSHESLPYFHRAISSPAGAADPSAHFNYANAMYNAVFELDTLAGRPLPVITSSVARLGLMRAVLDEYSRAFQLEPTPAKRALILNGNARALQVWGFDWEALIAHQRAQQVDPSNPAYADEAEAFMFAMRHPELARSVAPGEFVNR